MSEIVSGKLNQLQGQLGCSLFGLLCLSRQRMNIEKETFSEKYKFTRGIVVSFVPTKSMLVG